MRNDPSSCRAPAQQAPECQMCCVSSLSGRFIRPPTNRAWRMPTVQVPSPRATGSSPAAVKESPLWTRRSTDVGAAHRVLPLPRIRLFGEPRRSFPACSQPYLFDHSLLFRRSRTVIDPAAPSPRWRTSSMSPIAHAFLQRGSRESHGDRLRRRRGHGRRHVQPVPEVHTG
jgi:hypothetical protein